MEDLIEQYLFLYKQCPLPAVGTLLLKDGNAVTWHGDNKLSAPVPHIELSDVEIPAGGFIGFIAAKKKISEKAAIDLLEKYCSGLQGLSSYGEMKLEHSGKFYIDQAGKLLFKQDTLPKEFLPSVKIKRVVHSRPSSHILRVGDTETTSEVMTEYYSDKGNAKKEKWWIAALLLAIIGATALFFYFRENSINGNFGNTQKYQAAPEEKTYKAG
jgi:hypothetical protein